MIFEHLFFRTDMQGTCTLCYLCFLPSCEAEVKALDICCHSKDGSNARIVTGDRCQKLR